MHEMHESGNEQGASTGQDDKLIPGIAMSGEMQILLLGLLVAALLLFGDTIADLLP